MQAGARIGLSATGAYGIDLTAMLGSRLDLLRYRAAVAFLLSLATAWDSGRKKPSKLITEPPRDSRARRRVRIVRRASVISLFEAQT
jgi:hypothetical protein